MPQETSFGKAVLTAYAKVEKADGRVIYYRISDGENTEIDEETYRREAEGSA